MTNKKFNTENLCGRLDKDRGYNMNTCSGYPVWPLDPRPEDIRVEDIAGALSRICRYNGHLKNEIEVRRPLVGPLKALYASEAKVVEEVPLEIYSVAQHSVLVEQKVRVALTPETGGIGMVRQKILLAALLHDAPEYVLGDFIKPQKKMYAELSKYDTAWGKAIAERFGFDAALFDHPAIKEADYRIFLTEKRDLVNCVSTDFGTAEAEPYPERIIPALPSIARKMFMDRFNELYKGE